MNAFAAMSLSVLALLPAAACSHRPDPVPKPEAWPRIEAYPEAYSRDIDGFAVNDSAVIVPGDSVGWYTLGYPRYGGARIYLTFTSVDPSRLGGVVDNRVERMALNSGGGRSELLELRSEGGYDCRLMTTPAGTVTPLQFLACRGDGRVVSGALFVDGASTAQPDSFSPVVVAVGRDLVYALQRLK